MIKDEEGYIWRIHGFCGQTDVTQSVVPQPVLLCELFVSGASSNNNVNQLHCEAQCLVKLTFPPQQNFLDGESSVLIYILVQAFYLVTNQHYWNI